MKTKIASKLWMIIIFVFLYAPIVVLIAFSFNATKSRSVFSVFTLKWYKMLFEDDEIISAVCNTLEVAILATILAVILGTIAAIIVCNSKKHIASICTKFTNLPMLNPEIVTGVAMMILFVFLSQTMGLFPLGKITLVLSHAVFCTPYVMLNVLPRLRQTDKSVYEAAIDLGCSPMKAFWKVVLPVIKSSIFTGAIMAFTISVDDFVISYFVGGTVQTLSVTIYSMTKRLVTPEINALSSVLFVFVFVLLIIVNIRQSRDLKKSKLRGEN